MARSKLEEALDRAIKELFPFDTVLSEYPIKTHGKTLFVDRILPGRMIAIEVDGQQHDNFSAFFHKNADGWKSHQQRDSLKDQWLADNGYTLIRIKYNEKITKNLLRSKLLEAMAIDAI